MPPTLNQSMAPVPPVMGHPSVAGAPGVGPSKIDPNQIPRPVSSSSMAIFETRQNNQANTPPVCSFCTSKLFAFFVRVLHLHLSLVN